MSADKPASSAAVAAAHGTAETASKGSESPLERQIVHYARFVAPLATLLGAGVAGLVAGPPTAVLVLAGGALVAVIAIFWASLRVLFGQTPLSGADAYALGAPRAEEEQKQAVLRALKDLEFERSVGKISDEDYAELVAKYRAEAKRLLRLLDADAQPRREQVSALVSSHLRRAGLLDDGDVPEAAEQDDGAAASATDDAAASATDDAAREARSAKRKRARARRVEKQEGAEETAPADGERDGDESAAATAGAATLSLACASCGTMNDEDAVFCKKCGTRCAPGAALAEQAAIDEAAAGGDDNESRRAS